MAISNYVAAYVLKNSSDGELAAKMADVLFAAGATPPAPLVGFPESWVRAKQKRPVVEAAYAAGNCSIEDVVRDIFYSTKRVTVRESIANSKFRTEELRAEWHEYATEHNLWGVLNLCKDPGPSVEERVTKLLADIESYGRGGADVSGYPDIPLAANEISVEDADRITRAAISSGCGHVLAVVLDAHYRGRGGLGATTVPMGEIVAGISSDPTPRSYLRVATDLLQAILHRRSGEVVIDGNVVEFFIEHADPRNTNVRVMASNGRRHAQFTSEAIDKLIDQPAWRSIVLACELTNDQHAKLVASSSESELLKLTESNIANVEQARALIHELCERGIGQLSRIAVNTLLSGIGSSGQAKNGEEAEKCEDFEDLVRSILDMAGGEALIAWASKLINRVVTIEELDVIISKDLPTQMWRTGEFVPTRNGLTDYDRAYLDRAPCGLGRVLVGPARDPRGTSVPVNWTEASAYVWNRLEQSNCIDVMVLEQLSEHPELSLNEFIEFGEVLKASSDAL